MEFESVNSGRNDVEFSFTVEKSDIDYDPTSVPAVHYEVRSTDGTYYDDSWAESFEEVDDNTVRGTGSFTGLTPNIAYELVVSLSTESEVIELGKNSFDTYHEFKFQKKPSAEVSDTSTNFTISMKASYIGFVSQEETPDVINKLSISIVEKDGGTPTTHRFSGLSLYGGEYVIAPTGTIDGLTPGTTYTVSVYYLPDNEDSELLGTEYFTTTGINPGFSWGTIETSLKEASIEFNISKTYLDYDTDPDAAINSLSIQVKKDDALVDILTITSLNPESETSDNLIGTATASNLTPETTYTLTLVRNSQVVGKSTTMETEKVAFNGAIVPEQASFLSRQFSITLDFVDDPDNPQYDSLSIQLYDSTYDDSNKQILGNLITLESTTEEQYVDISNFDDFELGDIKSFEILATQVTVYHDDITFINIDASVNQVNLDNLITVDRSGSDPEVILPLQIEYTDNYQTLQTIAITLVPTVGSSSGGWCSASATEEYQSVTFSESDLITYIDRGNTEFVLNVFDGSNQSTPLWSNTVYLSVATVNRVYGGTVYNNKITSDDTNLSIDLACVYGAQTTEAQIVLINEAKETEYYVYDFSLSTFIIVDMTKPSSESTGATITDFSSLSAAMSGKTFTIRIDYNDGTDSQQKVIQTGVSFTFIQGD